jgi:ketosteroid isomerase-like protein
MRNNANIEIVRGIYRSFLAGRIDEVLEAFDEEIDWDGHVSWRGGPGGRSYEGKRLGREQVAGALREFIAQVRYERSAGSHKCVASGNSVLVTGSDIRRVTATGGLTENRWSMFWTLEEGKVVKFRLHQHTVDAAEPLPARDDEEMQPGSTPR